MSPRRPLSPSELRAFVDTSAYGAFADNRDQNHSEARETFRALARIRVTLHTTNLIIAETHALLKSRLAYYTTKPHAILVARRAIEAIYRSSVIVEPVASADERAALALLEHYGDQDFSFTDATSFVVMQRLSIAHAFSFDNDCVTAGFTEVRHIR